MSQSVIDISLQLVHLRVFQSYLLRDILLGLQFVDFGKRIINFRKCILNLTGILQNLKKKKDILLGLAIRRF